MPTINDQQTALRTKEAINKLVLNAINQYRPEPDLGNVETVTPNTRTCTVRFRDETTAIPCRLGALIPSVGQAVQVTRIRGVPWVTNLIGTGTLGGTPTDDLAAPNLSLSAGLPGALLASWDPVTGADRYEVQLAESAFFDTGLQSHITIGYQLRIDSVTIGQTYTVRVRAVNSNNGTGPWSVQATGTVVDFPDGGSSNGLPPSFSPQPVLTGAIGVLLVAWQPVPNDTTVTYEVHASSQPSFEPDRSFASTTLIQETTGEFISIRRLPGAINDLPKDADTYVRIIAKDADGDAPAGPQAAGRPDSLDSNDFENLDFQPSDGQPPASSPTSITVRAGIGFLWLAWPAVENADPVYYDIHLWDSPNFTPNANSFVATTPGTFAILREESAGLGGDALSYDTTYQIRIYARDADGFAPAASPTVVGTPIKAGTTDLENIDAGLVIESGTIGQALIGEAAIGAAQIIDGEITNAKIANGTIERAKIGNAAIGEAQIGDLAVSNAKIANGTITDAKIASLSADKITAGTISSVNLASVNISGSVIEVLNELTIVVNTPGDRSRISFPQEAGVFYPGFAPKIESFGLDDGANGKDAGLVIQSGLLDGSTQQVAPYLSMESTLFGSFDVGTITASANTIRLGTSHHPVPTSLAERDASCELDLESEQLGIVNLAGRNLRVYYGDNRDTNLNNLVNRNNRTFDLELDEFGDLITSRRLDDLNSKRQIFKVGETLSRIVTEQLDIDFGFWDNQANNVRVRKMRYDDTGNVFIFDPAFNVLWQTNTTASDRRLKKRVRVKHPSIATKVVRDTDFVEYRYRPDTFPTGRRYGVVAQQLRKSYPSGVSIANNDMKQQNLDPHAMIGLLFGAIKDVDERLMMLEK